MSVLSSVDVAFAPAPERVARAAQFVRHFHRLLHLRGGVGKHIGVATRARAVDVTRIGKQIGRAPEQLDAGALLFLLQHFRHGVEILVRSRPAFCLPAPRRGRESIKRRAQFLDELKRHARAVLRVADGIGAVVPRALHRARAKRIAARAAKGVPVNHRKTQMLAHRFAVDDFIGVVMLERQRIFGTRTFVVDCGYVFECLNHKL